VSPETADGRRWRGAAFATPSLRLLQASWAAASTGAWTFMVALAVYAYGVGGAAAVGIVGFARMVPAGVLAPVAGLAADRWSRRNVLVTICVGRAVLLAVLTVVVTVDAPLVWVLVLAAAVTVLTTAHTPAQAALFTALASTPRQLASCNGVANSIGNGGFLAGSLLGGVLASVTSSPLAFAVTALAFAVAVIPLLGVPADPVPAYRIADQRGPGWVFAETARGVREVAGDPGLRLLIGTLGASTLIEGALDVLVVVTALSLVDLGAAGVGWLNAAWGVGGLLGGGGALVLLHRGRYAAALSIGGLLAGAAIAVLAALPYAVIALAALVVVGVGYSFVEVSGSTLLQRQASDEVLARAFGVAESCYWLTTGVGALLAPVAIAALGPRGAVAAVGGALVVLLALPWWPLRRLEVRTRVPAREFALLRRVPMLAPLPSAAVETLALRAGVVPVPHGHVVIREGERGDRYYVVADGRFAVEVGGVERGEIGPGGAFGETALLRDIPRTATVTAQEPGLLLGLDRDDFLTVVTGHPRTAQLAHAVADRYAGPRGSRGSPAADGPGVGETEVDGREVDGREVGETKVGQPEADETPHQP
jgi:MFS family permease